MKEGEITEPFALVQQYPVERIFFHILYLKKRIEAHTVNLKEDYEKLADAAMRGKKDRVIREWVDQAKKDIRIDVKNENCAKVLMNMN